MTVSPMARYDSLQFFTNDGEFHNQPRFTHARHVLCKFMASHIVMTSNLRLLWAAITADMRCGNTVLEIMDVRRGATRCEKRFLLCSRLFPCGSHVLTQFGRFSLQHPDLHGLEERLRNYGRVRPRPEHPKPQINMLRCVLCVSWCAADFEVRGMRRGYNRSRPCECIPTERCLRCSR